MLKEIKGMERIIVALTGKRLYNCCDCNLYFRMPDRRREERDPNAPATESDIAGRSQDSRQGSAEDTDRRR
jgi:hypothetical protein